MRSVLRLAVAVLLLLCMAGAAEAATYNITVYVKDMSAQPLLNSTVTLDSTQQTATDGSTTFSSIPEGNHGVLCEASGYQPANFVIDLTSDLDLTTYLSNASRGGHLTTIQFFNGLVAADSVLVEVFYDDTMISSAYAGGDGRVAFWLESSKLYTIRANQSCNYTLMPAYNKYAWQLCDQAGYVWTNESVNTNLTNYTTDYSDEPWSLQNLTGDWLETEQGLGPLGQGILSSIVVWIVMGFGVLSNAVIGVGVLVVMAILGIVSWIIVLFCGMTVVSLYILRGGIG